MLLYTILAILIILLVINIILTIKAGKKEPAGDLAEVKFSISALTAIHVCTLTAFSLLP